MNPLNLDLTAEQQFFLERLKRTTPLMSKEELGRILIEVQSQCFGYQNAFKSVVGKQNQ